MREPELAEQFEAHRARLQAGAYRMLGSFSESEDAVQEAWLRLSRSDTGAIENLGGWLTTVVGRVCLDTLRARATRREGPSDRPGCDARAPDEDASNPEYAVELAESVGLALLVVLDRLGPAERVAFVLHDMLAVPFADIAMIVGRSPAATKQLASRARRRVHGASPCAGTELARRWRVVDAFLAATRDGDLDALLAVLDPDAVRHADRQALPAHATTELRGNRSVAEGTLVYARSARRLARPALLDGACGLIVAPLGRLRLALRFTIERDKIVAIDVIADPARLRQLDLKVRAA